MVRLLMIMSQALFVLAFIIAVFAAVKTLFGLSFGGSVDELFDVGFVIYFIGVMTLGSSLFLDFLGPPPR